VLAGSEQGKAVFVRRGDPKFVSGCEGKRPAERLREKEKSYVTYHTRALSAGFALAIFAFALASFVAPRGAFAAPKQIVNAIGSPEVGEAGSRFNTPAGVAVNQTGAGGVPSGTFYVVDSKDRRVQRFGPSGDFVSTWGFGVREGNREFEICTEAEECQEGYPSGAEGAAGSFESPQGIAVDQTNGKVYVSDAGVGGRVSVFDATGGFEGAFGLSITGDFSGELRFCTAQTGCAESFFPTAQGGDFFSGIGGLAVDAGGNVYVANPGYRRVDVFKPTLVEGAVTGIEFVHSFGWGVNAGNAEFEVCSVASECKEGLAGSGVGQFASNSPSDVGVDSEGNVFALDAGNNRVQKFSSAPAPIDAAFGSASLAAVFDDDGTKGELLNIAIDPSATPNHVLVSGSRAGSEGKVAIAELDGSGENVLGTGQAHGEELSVASANGLAVANASIGGNIYVSTETVGTLRGVFVLNEVPTIAPVTDFTGTTALFKGEIISNGIAVTYHFEYSTDGKAWSRVPASDVDAGTGPGTIAVEQEATNLSGSQLYRVRLVQNRPLGGGNATSDETTFTTLAEKPAILGTLAFPVKDTSATFNAYLDPQNEATTYRFEYGPADCLLNPCTALPVSNASGGGLRLVSQTVTGLEPGLLYHFRLVATNLSGTTAGPDRTFETFVAGRRLPDDRAYELVTPPDTGAVVLAGTAFGEVGGRNCFDMFPVTPEGDSVVSLAKGGSLPGLDVNGFWDLYESVRDPITGWSTVAKSASGGQATTIGGGLCSSPDHTYSTLGTGTPPNEEGSLLVEGRASSYIRVPGGVIDESCSSEPQGLFELVGCGSMGVDPEANARWITSGAGHVVFTANQQLEPGAPPSGTEAIYDRSLGGPTQVASLLPGDVPLEGGQSAEYQGTSVDGSAIVFKVGGTMYVRLDNADTLEVAGEPNTFAGISRNGRVVFYANGDGTTPDSLFAFDVGDGTATEIAPNSIFVNVSEGGSHVYLISQSALAGAGEAGKDNLYVWERGSEDVRFVTTVTPEDLNGPVGLTQWTSAAVHPQPSTLRGRANDPSRTTPDGSVFLFESHAKVTGYDSNGHIQIYRYEADDGSLDCVSCPPDGVPATGDARLQSNFSMALNPTSSIVHIQNVTDDGEKVFFQTEDALAPGDVNDTWDVYEWKAGQQAYLISSGESQLPSFLYGMTPSGSDIFFTSAERLVPQDLSTVISIYDAREGGGFSSLAGAPPPCQGDDCQGTPNIAPQLPGAGAASFQGPGNEARKRKPRCRKNQRRVMRKGKVRCVKKHSRKAAKRRHRAQHDRRAAR
jgi:NHL repeat-containing protein